MKQHNEKKVLFLMSLPDEIASASQTAQAITYCIDSLKKRNVEIRSTISAEDLQSIINYDLVIVVTHTEGETFALADGSHLSFKEFYENLPADYQGALDLSACFSAKLKPQIKLRCPDCDLLLLEDEGKLEKRLFLSQFLVDEFRKNSDSSVKLKQIYDEVDLRFQNTVKAHPSELAKETTKLGTTIECSAKEKVCKMAPFPISIHILPDHENGSLRIERVIQARLDYVKLSMNLKKGDEIAVDITFSTEPCELCDEYSKYLHCKEITPKSVIWDETTDALITFKCNVSNEFPLGAFDAIITMKVNGEEILRDWNINIEVDNNNNGTNKMPNVPEQDRLPNDVELSYTDIKGYENKTTDEITEEIDKKINKAKQLEKEGMVVASSILDDYNELKRIIISSDRVLENQRKTICLLNKRLGMLDSLQKIRSEIDPNPSGLLKVDLVKLQDSIAKITGEFFSPINDSFLETIYVKNDGTKVHKFYRDEYTKAYRVLAIKLAVPLIDKKIIHYYVPQESTDKEVCPRVDDESSRSVNNRGLDYINILLKNNSIRTQLENYLKTTEGKSSVIAFYLLELYKHNV